MDDVSHQLGALVSEFAKSSAPAEGALAAAVHKLEQQETQLSDDEMVTVMRLFRNDPKAAEQYLAIQRPALRAYFLEDLLSGMDDC